MAITFNQISERVFKLDNPKIITIDNRDKQISEFIQTTINGDETKAYLAINAYLKPKNLGVLLYILTNVRLIKIEIGENEGINSSSFFLSKMISIDRKLIGKDISSIDIIFQNTSVGLRYSVFRKEITDFFQTIEQLKAEKD